MIKLPLKLTRESSIPLTIPFEETEPAKGNAEPVTQPTPPTREHLIEQTFRNNSKQPKETNLIIIALVAFILTGLFPPWQFTTDKDSVNGTGGTFGVPPAQGVHSKKTAGYSLIFTPPTNPDNSAGNGIQIDFGRLFVEWLIVAASTSIFWILVAKPAWLYTPEAKPTPNGPP